MIDKKVFTALFVAMSIAAGAASAQTITFDDINDTGYGVLISNGYQGLNWNNFWVANATIDPSWAPPYSGYANGIVSGPNITYNGGGNPATISSTTAFTLNDAYFTGAFNNGLQIQAVATSGANTYTKDFTVNTNAPTDVIFNFSNITSVTFTSSGGTSAGYVWSPGEQFVMDNLTITPVPEPETYAMLLAGLVLVGFTTLRRKQNFAV